MNKQADFKNNILSLDSKGLDTVSVTKNMFELGVAPLNAQEMLEDIKKAGSSEAYYKSPEYQAYTIGMKELNKQMTLDMNKSLNDLLKDSTVISDTLSKKGELIERNKQMTLEMNKNLDSLFSGPRGSNFKTSAELAAIAANQSKGATEGIKSEVAGAASEAAAEVSSAAADAASSVSSEVQAAVTQTAAETMLADIKAMGSEAYTQSQAYADSQAAQIEANKKAQEQLDKTLQELLNN
jgi:hypothetical protein